MDAKHRQYEVSDKAVQEAYDLGFTGDIKSRVARMARRSANCSHKAGNRRFEDFVLKIEGGVVKGIALWGDK
jgi:hypothetical protein